MSSFVDRIWRACKLDARLYEEVEADESSLGQAMLVIVFASLAAGIGAISILGIHGLLAGTVTALAGWYVWAYLTYLIGTRLLPERDTEADPGQLLRTLGFASAPGLIRILGIFPLLRPVVFFGGSLWMLLAMVVAVRQALDYRSTARAVFVCLIGWIVQFLLLILVHFLLGR